MEAMGVAVRQWDIAQLLRDRGEPLTAKEISDGLGVACSSKGVNSALHRMDAAGIVKHINGRWKLLDPEYAEKCRLRIAKPARDDILFAVYWRDSMSGLYTGVIQPSFDLAKVAAEEAEPNAWKGIVKIRSVEARL